MHHTARFAVVKGENCTCFEPSSGTTALSWGEGAGLHEGLPIGCSGRISAGERLRWTDVVAGRREHTPGTKVPLVSCAPRDPRLKPWGYQDASAIAEAKAKTTASAEAKLEAKAKKCKCRSKRQVQRREQDKCGGLYPAAAKAPSPVEMTRFLSKGIEWNRQRQKRRRYD